MEKKVPKSGVKVQCVWYVCPDPDHTKNYIVELLGNQGFCDEVMCSDGKRRNMWLCRSYADVAALLKGQVEHQLTFTIWYRKGRNARIEPWTLGTRPVRKQMNVRAVRRLLHHAA